MTLAIDLPDGQLDQLRLVANRAGIPVEELVRAMVLAQLAQDESFEDAAQHVLQKNEELYRRLG
ncbi:MAG: DNA-binding protein [Proteobacteria bacterium]|nr:DNA-binding protein [Pseudomonadota bacterium]